MDDDDETFLAMAQAEGLPFCTKVCKRSGVSRNRPHENAQAIAGKVQPSSRGAGGGGPAARTVPAP